MSPRRSAILGIFVAAQISCLQPAVLFGQAAQLTGPTAPSTKESDLSALFNEAMAAFQNGDYAGAAPKFEKIIAEAGEGAQLESVYFTLGAAYYNMEQYSRAVEALKTCVQKYPNGSQVTNATYFLGQACMAAGDAAGAAEQFSKLATVPAFREQALYFAALAYKKAERPDDAIRSLEMLIQPEIRSARGVKGAMLLAALYGEKKEPEKANAIAAKVLQKTDLVDDLAQLNAMAVELGDSDLESGRPAEALVVYRFVRPREDVIAFQADRVVSLKKEVEKTLAALRAHPKEAADLIQQFNDLRLAVADATKLAEASKSLPDFTPALNLRIGRAFYDLGSRWEATVAYNEILDRYPDTKERESALFGVLVNYAELNRPNTARETGERYLKEFPDGPNADTAGYLMGASALQADDPQTAESYFGRMLKERPASTFKEEMLYLLGNARFAQGKFEEALKDYEEYKNQYPKGTHAEDVEYRCAVGLVFQGKYEAAIPATEHYLQVYPKGTYAPDAKYRLALCYYAANQYDDVIKRCQDWEKDYPNDQQLGEVLALLGDSQKAKGDLDDSIDSHIRSFKLATTDEVLNYSLFEAQKSLQKKGDWGRMSEMFQEFVKDHPEHPLVPMAMYWIGKAKARDGKVDEAKAFIADITKRYMADPGCEAVEQLLTQLSELCARKKRVAPATSGTAAPSPSASPDTVQAAASPTPSPIPEASPTPSATPSATPEQALDPVQELEKLLGDSATTSETGKARLLFAKSEIARVRKKSEEQTKQLSAIADIAPEALSPMLLALVGDLMLERGDQAKAEALFQRLMEEYPKSAVVDFAYNGLGELAYAKQDWPRALSLFSQCIDEGTANQKLKQLTVGRAKTLLAEGKLDEAQKLFEQVASAREWRGEATAFAVYSLGEIEWQRGKWPEANAYYQRVFVAYQKYLPWVAKAYVKSGACFEKLGKKPEASRTYQEMLRNEKLAKFEESSVVRARLQEIGGDSAQ